MIILLFSVLFLNKSYCNYLYTNDYIVKKHCANIIFPREELEPVEIKFFTKEEQIKLQENLDLEKDTDLMILLVLSSGLRLGEARGLKWENLKNNALTIDHQIQFVTRVEKDGSRSSKEEISELKTASSYRKIPLPESVSKVLRNHKIKQTEIKLLLGKEYHDEGFIFTRGDEKLLGKRRLERRLEKLEEKLKLTKVTPHGLMRTYCTRLIEENIPVKQFRAYWDTPIKNNPKHLRPRYRRW